MNTKTIKQYYSCLSKQRSFGVDISSNNLKIFQIEKKKDKYKVIGWAKKKFPKKVIDNFEIRDKNKFAEIFEDTLSVSTAKKIKGSSVMVAVPEEKVFLRVIDIPAMLEEEIPEAIKLEVEENIPVSIDKVYFDWQVVEKGKKEMKVLIAASPKHIVDSFVETFDQIGLHACVFEASSMAMGRSVLSRKEKGPILVVDIGSDGVRYFIYYKGYPMFSSSGSVSGQMFTDVVAKYYGFVWEKAEHHKTKIGLGFNKKEKEEALKIYNPLLTTLTQEIEKTIYFYDENLCAKGSAPVQKIILCGGGSNFKGILPYLAIHLKRQVIQGNPWENVELVKKIPPIAKDEVQDYATAIGLAIRECDYGHHD